MRIRFDEIIKNPAGYVFAAIDFSSKYKPIYDEVIYPAVADAGIRLIRSDKVLSASKSIHEQICQLIKNSKFVIADASFIRQSSFGNIFWEIGISVAFDKPLIILTQDDDIPSDIRYLNLTKYDTSEQGKAILKKELTSVLLQALNPPEYVLKKMLHLNGYPNHIVFGHARETHIAQVFPLVGEQYKQRLGESSSEAAGIALLTNALNKVGWSMGRDSVEIRPVNSHMMTDNICLNGNKYVFGGPGANRHFIEVTRLANSLYENALNICSEDVGEGKKRYYIARAGLKHPEQQYKLYDEKKDVGFLMRFPDPENPETVIVVAAGIRSYGTEGAIKLLMTPSLITKIDFWEKLDREIGFWAIVEVSFENEETNGDNLRVIDSELLIERKE